MTKSTANIVKNHKEDTGDLEFYAISTCFPSYTKEEVDKMEQFSVKRLKSRKEEYNQTFYQQNKGKRAKQYQRNKDEIANKYQLERHKIKKQNQEKKLLRHRQSKADHRILKY